MITANMLAELPNGVLSEDTSLPVRLEDALPPEVFSRILTDSGVWRVPDLGTLGPWNVSKVWPGPYSAPTADGTTTRS